MAVKNLAIAGNAVREYWVKVRIQEGSLGCRVAQERAVCEGLAGDVMGERTDRVGGKVVGRLGKRMGETKGLSRGQLLFVQPN